MAEPQRLTPKAMTRDELVALLEGVTELVRQGDSWEGLINWLMPLSSDTPDVDFRVEARFRVGNSQGQGGFTVIGDWVDKHDHVVRHVDPQRGLG